MAKKIVIIDDEAGICEVLARTFESEGYEVKSETDALKGLELVEKEKPDCVLLDVKMPEIDGVSALARIKEKNKDIVVIMITAYGTFESAMESINKGAYDYIAKPFDFDYMKKLVARSLAANTKK